MIHRSGNVMTAEYRVNREVIKSAKATCAPSDTFDFDTGAKLAFDRLMGREEPKHEPTKPPHHWIESAIAASRSKFATGDRVSSVGGEGNGTVVGFERDGNADHGIDWVYVEWDKYPNMYNPKLEKNLRLIKKSYTPKPEPQPAHRFKVGDRVLHEEYGLGTIIGYVNHVAGVPYKVRPDNVCCVTDNWAESRLSPAPAPEPPKFYTGKVVCISGEYGVGRIFTVKDGFFVERQYNCPGRPYKSVDDMNDRFLFGKFAEAKE